MATTLQMLEQGTATDLLTTELNSLANNTMCTLGAEFNNVQATANFQAYPRAKLQFLMAAYTGTPIAGAALYVWFLRTVDGGTTYEDGSATVTPARRPDAIIPVAATATGPQKITVACNPPVGKFKAVAKNVGTGLALAATGNKLTILPNTDQGV